MDGVEITRKRLNWGQILVLMILALGIYAGTCSKPVLFDETDSTNAEVALRMFRTGDWTIPYSNYVPRLNKPPMVYWTIASSYEVLGISDFSARLPLALAAVALVMMTFAIGNLFSGGRAGFYSGLVLATCGSFFLFTRMIGGDVLFVLFLSVAFYAFLRAYLDGSHYAVLAFYPAVALAVLSKGLIGIVFPMLIIGAFLIAARDLKFLKRMHLIPGLALFLLVAAPWHILVERTHPGFLYNYIVDEHVLRFVGRHYPKDFTSVPVWEYWVLTVGGFFPWIVFVPSARRYWNLREHSRNGTLLLFLVCWVGTILIFFSISARLEHYGLPAYPALAAMAGFALSRWQRSETVGRSYAPLVVVFIGLAITSAVGGALLAMYHRDAAAALLAGHNQMTFLSAAGGLSVGSLAAMRLEIAMVGAAMLVIALSALLMTRSSTLAPSAGMALGMVVVFVAIQLAMQSFAPSLTLRSFADRIDRDWKPGDTIVVEGDYFDSSSLGFYTRKPIYRWRGHPEWEYGSRFDGAQGMYLDDDELERLWRSDERVFLVARQRPRFLDAPAEMAEVGSHGLFTNRLDPND